MANRRTLGGRMKHWAANGPYTFAAVLSLAKQCARSQDWQVGDDLSDVIGKFSFEEFEKIMNPQRYCMIKELEQWKKGTCDWQLDCLPDIGTFTDQHCEIIAQSKTCARAVEHFLGCERTLPAHRARIIKTIRDIQRDASPVRQ